MFQARCPQNCTPRANNCTPRANNCGQDPRVAAAAKAGIQGGQCVDLFDAEPQICIEPAMTTAPNIINHHRRIEHIVPVITEDIHRHHAHHEFVARPEHRVRQTFDSNVSIGRPLPAQQFVQNQPMMQMPVQQQQFMPMNQAPIGQQQLVPVEVDVIERFGFAPQGNNFGANNFGTNNFGNFAQQTQGMPFTGIANQALTQAQMQGFIR